VQTSISSTLNGLYNSLKLISFAQSLDTSRIATDGQDAIGKMTCMCLWCIGPKSTRSTRKSPTILPPLAHPEANLPCPLHTTSPLSDYPLPLLNAQMDASFVYWILSKHVILLFSRPCIQHFRHVTPEMCHRLVRGPYERLGDRILLCYKTASDLLPTTFPSR